MSYSKYVSRLQKSEINLKVDGIELDQTVDRVSPRQFEFSIILFDFLSLRVLSNISKYFGLVRFIYKIGKIKKHLNKKYFFFKV